MTRRQVRGIAISAWWVLVIIVPICIFVLWIAVDHANRVQDRAQHRANQQFAKAVILTDRKFREALHVQATQTAYAVNKSACGWRAFAGPALKSYEAAANDPTLSPSARARNDKRIKTTREFLANQVTIPSTFDCSRLPKAPPK